ncbi:MAG: TorF family putative porin [Rhizobiaceae bacterium]|nr:TorF family putative porin [Rhizobiaceae bacterium]
MKSLRIATLALAASAVLASSALAADEVEVTQEQIASAFDIAFGATLTSRYVSRGVAQTNGPAVQGYIEGSYNIFYAGVWASSLDSLLAPDDVEIDLYAGIRPEFGNLSLDLGYVRYLYNSTGDCCGEAYAKATYAFTEEFSAGAEIYYDFENDTTYGDVNAEVSLPYDFAVSGAVGTWFDGRVDWNAGISYTYADTLTFDLRYHDADYQPARFVAMVSVDSSWSALKGMMNR